MSSMVRSAISSVLLFLFSLVAFAADQPKVQILPLNQVKAGMHGVAYTVFEGTTPEAMEVEILGVLHNMAGPKSDVILARLHGKKVEYTGVVAGMSGSPVYIDGQLVGAIAYRIGEFSKEPIAGITPAGAMLEIDEMDSTPAPDVAQSVARENRAASRMSGPGEQAGLDQQAAGYANLLKPIETPLVLPDSAKIRCGSSPRILLLPVLCRSWARGRSAMTSNPSRSCRARRSARFWFAAI